jgi:hypothetical protein
MTKPFSKTKLILLLSLALVLVSGCTTQTTGGNGVMVKDFGPEFGEIYAGEPINFRLLVKNEGSVNAQNVHAELLGLDEDWCDETKATKGCEASAGGRKEKMPNEPECSYKGDGFNMLAPDPQRGTEGSQHICTWSYKAPPIPKGFEITYTPTVRVFYSYKSGVVKLITFGSSSELRTIQDTGGKLPTETVSTTSSPVQLSIETKGPIRFWQEESKVIFPLEITIRNTGGGVACAFDDNAVTKDACKVQSGEAPKNKIRLMITFGNAEMELMDECKEFKGGKTISLWKGQSNSIVCEVEATSLGSGATIQRMIKAEAFYEYYTDTESSIKVIGRDLYTYYGS